ncbi:hypothetical protein MPDQ_003468 [Monascus purpureus]|uniref:Cytochrome b561 domain-containing protein n=1 Tax=Monascus purpureus TaxID=5098 RepID=A0A507R1G6_MONPU|nr:hypothetical protein MPDQ_003468 [Monascus purpureus]
MASPEQRQQHRQDPTQYEPLLGQTGDVGHLKEDGIYRNLFTGTAAIAQAGVLIVQAALILQPTTTSTPRTKLLGTKVHYVLQSISILAFLSGLIIIEINKGDHPRFTSFHGVVGLITYISIVLQALVGVIQYFFPAQILGSVGRGKQIYKYHRLSGYALLVLELVAVLAATQTTYNVNILKIPFYPVAGAGLLLLVGVGSRVQRQKLGL